MAILAINGHTPRIDPSAWVHSSAQIIGDVEIGAQSSIWFNTVVRGDRHAIRIGARTNIQDNSTVHITADRCGTSIGDDVTAGHNVILHACSIADRCLIGMGAIIMDGVEVGADCLIAAGALLTPGTKILPGHLVVGSPARVARPLRPEEVAELLVSASNYVENARTFRAAGIV